MLYMPRRHRRKLLLPPGLLALAFLLLVGCEILTDRFRLRSYSIIQLTTPRLCSDPNKILKTICVPSTAILEKEREWCFIDFTGDNTSDSSSLRLIQNYLYTSHPHPDSITYVATTGLAIRFHDKSKYASLIWALDHLNHTDNKRYFFHIYSSIPTIHVPPRFGWGTL